MLNKTRTKLIKILDSWIGVIFFIIALFFLHRPLECDIIPGIYDVETYVRVFVIIVLVFSLIIIDGSIKKLFSEEMLLWACLAWGVIVVIATIVNKGVVANSLWTRSILLFALALLVSVFFKANFKKYLFIVFIYCLVITTINNFCVFYFLDRGGMWGDWGGPALAGRVLVGNVNSGSNFAFIAALAGGIYAYCFNKYWDIVNAVSIVFTLLMAIKADSNIQITEYVLIMLIMILVWISKYLPKSQKVLKWFNAKTLVVFDVALFVFTIPLKGLGLFSKVGIDSTFSGRRAIWDTAMKRICEHPLLGGNPYRNILVISNGQYTMWPSTHSIFLQVPYETGFIGLAFFIVIVLVCVLAISKIENFQRRFFMGAMIGLFFFIMIMDVNIGAFIFLCLGIFYYAAKSISGDEQTTGNI